VTAGDRDGWFYARRGSLSSLTGYLANRTGTPVIDHTGLTGIWDVDLKWEAPPLSDVPGAGTDMNLDPISASLREQLGLTLQATKSDIEALVIERAERPSPN
jgi:uncharacterized protein (TIGR03435 family)